MGWLFVNDPECSCVNNKKLCLYTYWALKLQSTVLMSIFMMNPYDDNGFSGQYKIWYEIDDAVREFLFTLSKSWKNRNILAEIYWPDLGFLNFFAKIMAKKFARNPPFSRLSIWFIFYHLHKYCNITEPLFGSSVQRVDSVQVIPCSWIQKVVIDSMLRCCSYHLCRKFKKGLRSMKVLESNNTNNNMH